MMQVYLFIVLCFSLAYACLILFYRMGWKGLNEHQFDKTRLPTTKVTVIIPARNEEATIANVLQDILAQAYPAHLLEILVIDDHSEDNTAKIVAAFKNVQCISLQAHSSELPSKAYKKKAIEIAIQQCKGELIVTTDADCRMCEYWLAGIVNYFETYKPVMIAAPVIYTNSKEWFSIFQSLDFMTMQGITAAVVSTRTGSMCNGANLAYTKQAFDAVYGFSGVDHLASGDDMFLMYKMEKQFPGKTTYMKCKDSIVYTYAAPSRQAFITQRIRWASKSTQLKDKRIQAVLMMVFIWNALFPITILLAFITPSLWFLFFVMLCTKIVVELLLVVPISKFFKKSQEVIYLVLLQGIHILYILYVAIAAQIKPYTWKNRKIG
jgi:cellulose synthase/poly-beta-1,6-N-acetylglucosamine synthase-like glycosyltransferase